MCFTLYRRQLDNTVSAEAVFTEKGRFNEKTDVPLGWVNFQFIDHKDQLRQGLCSFKLWLGKPNPIGTCVENVAVKDKERATTLHVEFQIHRTAVYFPPPPTVNPADAAAAARGSSQPVPAPADASKQKIIKLQLEEIMKKGWLPPATRLWLQPLPHSSAVCGVRRVVCGAWLTRCVRVSISLQIR